MSSASAPVTDPFHSPPVLEDHPPQPARLEIVERHAGVKWPDDRPIVPNVVRMNGVQLWCPVDAPIVVEKFTIDGNCGRPLVVRLKLQARVLAVGDQPARIAPDADDVRARRFATVELPARTGEEPLTGLPDNYSIPYAIVNGMKIQLGDDVLVHQVEVGERQIVVVTLPLVCRSVVFDDESSDPVPV